MASDSRALTLKLLADVADFQRKIDQSEKTTDGFSGKVQEFGKKAGLAFAAAGAAAAAYAGKLLVDGVKSAMADEQAQTRLAAALRQATNATDEQIASTEEYITKTSIAVGVTDDELRPSLQRLSIATGDLTKAQQLQKIALDVAAGSGKSLESVTNALARAYEGNNSSLSRLGIGLSAAELKAMSFDQVTATLANTFQNQASIQADTFQGKLTRLQIGFDEAKEAVGARLLPILTQLLTIFTDKIIPAAQSLLDKFKPLTTAIQNNREEFEDLWAFLDKYIVPILTGALKAAFVGTVTAITTVINAVGRTIDFFQDLFETYRKLIEFLKNNPLSRFLSNMNPFNRTNFTTTSYDDYTDDSGSGANYSNPFFPTVPFIPTQKYLDAVQRTEELKAETEAIRERINSRKNVQTTAQNVTINVGVSTDPEGTARTIRDIFIDSLNRGTGGLAGAI